MTRRGPKGKAKIFHMRDNTERKDRVIEEAVIPLHGEVERPKWLKGKARKVFEEKLEIYKKRGQSIVGLERMLAHYCQLEVLLIELWKTPTGPTPAAQAEYRRWCSDFFDSPASQLIRPGNKDPDNSFDKHGIR